MIVIVEVPVVAVELAVKVRTLVEVVGLVPNEAVTPDGSAEFESVTLPVKPPLGVTVIVELPLLPRVTLKLLGEADSEKLGVATPFTVNEIDVVWLSVPDVPVTVTDDVPVVAVELAVKVTTLLPVVGFVPKLAVTPLGRADVESVTLPVKPPDGVTVTVELPLLPCARVKLLGEADSEKFGRDTTGKFTQLLAELENSNWTV